MSLHLTWVSAGQEFIMKSKIKCPGLQTITRTVESSWWVTGERWSRPVEHLGGYAVCDCQGVRTEHNVSSLLFY